MEQQHSLKPLWIGIACMALGVLCIYWVFHSGKKTIDDGGCFTEECVRRDAGVVCVQVMTPAKNPDTGEIVEFSTPCDVPEGWEIIKPATEEWEFPD